MNETQLKHLEEGLRDPESVITPEIAEADEKFWQDVRKILGQ